MRAQVKMGETIAVLFIFFILLGFGMAFFMKFHSSVASRASEEDFSKKTVQISQAVSFLPEIQCSRENVIQNACFDLYKLTASSPLIKKNNIEYFDVFSYSNITVKQIYPEEDTYNIYDNVKPNWTRKYATPIPVSIYDPIKRTYGFGVLKVEVYG